MVGLWTRALAKRALSTNVFLPFADAKRYVFCYHDISEPDAPGHSPEYSTPPQMFRDQIEALGTRFQWVDLEELLTTTQPKRHLAALTFDDGFASVRDVAWPYLREQGIPFFVFVCRSAIEDNCLAVTTRTLLRRLREVPMELAALLTAEGSAGYTSPRWNDAMSKHRDELTSLGLFDTRLYLNADDISFLRDHGVRFGSHSATHRVLTTCDPEQLEAEIIGNQTFLAERFGIDSRHFALPFGKKTHRSMRVLDALVRCGYRYVYTSNPVDVSSEMTDAFRLVPRIGVTNEDPRTLLFYVNRPFLKRIDL